ncbi:phosphotransmitter protein Ypd1 [Thermoascus aurantiacus ATCC 26904]
MAPSLKGVDGTPDLADYGDIIDPATFEQILEMDDDKDREFSKGIVYGFFDQAESTFVKMEKALSAENLSELSQLGHFLKGSSATLGLTKVKDACEKIQHFGARKDETGTVEEPDEATALANIKQTLNEVKEDYNEVATILRRFYGEKTS